ncbi:MAG: hypothetical protein HDR99_01470 [Bacteroides sp.]|nr:hypothetical protein [Bacteroides sp.]
MNRKLLLAFALSILATLPVAAEYKPLLEEGKSWTCRYFGRNWASTNPYYYGIGMSRFYQMFTAEVGGDTIVAGKQCKRIVQKGMTVHSSTPYTHEHFLLEENETVYFCAKTWKDSLMFIPMMRFDVSVGDSMAVYYLNYGYEDEPVYYDKVTGCDVAVGSDGVERREVIVDNSSWVEGIGYSNCYSFMLYDVSGQDCTDRLWFETMDCSVNGKSVFTRKDFNLQFDDSLDDSPELETIFTRGKSWTMARGDEMFTVSVVGDTLIRGVPATRLIDSNGKDYAVIEDHGIIYTFFDRYGEKSPLSNAVPLMNQNLSEGRAMIRYILGQEYDWDKDANGQTNRYKCHVSKINTLVVNGVERKEWVLEDEGGNVIASWVDGIGSPDANSWPEMEMPADYDLRMIDCRQDGEVIFTAEDFTHQSGIREVSADGTNRAGAYDLQGRRVDHPTRGLFIINGKKTLLK